MHYLGYMCPNHNNRYTYTDIQSPRYLSEPTGELSTVVGSSFASYMNKFDLVIPWWLTPVDGRNAASPDILISVLHYQFSDTFGI